MFLTNSLPVFPFDCRFELFYTMSSKNFIHFGVKKQGANGHQQGIGKNAVSAGDREKSRTFLEIFTAVRPSFIYCTKWFHI